ncbi:MAG TPA: MFS transporter [Solirubrobacteraceae bacterium]|jgi:MFS family permease
MPRLRLKKIAVDLTALRESRDFRLLAIGQLISNIGSEAAVVALPLQVFLITHSPALVGLIGAAELGPLMVVSLLGGAIADRTDRRLLLLAAQVGMVLTAGALAAITLAGQPPVAVIFVLAALLAGSVALETASRAAIVPNVAGSHLRSALSFNYGLYQLTQVIGPALGGVLIAATSIGAAYVLDAASCLAMVVSVLAMSPQRPQRAQAVGEQAAGEPAVGEQADGTQAVGEPSLGTPQAVGEPSLDTPQAVGEQADGELAAVKQTAGARSGEQLSVLRSIAEGLRFVRGNSALLGSFAIDLVAMTFGMPRALFAVLSITVYHAGASGTGALYAAVAIGATVAALTTGWIEHAQRLGRITIVAVLVWGGAIAAAGAVRSLAPALVLLALAGAADSVSAVCRTTINQIVTPDAMRGRMSAVYSMVVRAGPRLGDIESGLVASATTASTSVISGGLACLGGVGLIVLAFPALAAFHGIRDAVQAPAAAAEPTAH